MVSITKFWPALMTRWCHAWQIHYSLVTFWSTLIIWVCTEVDATGIQITVCGEKLVTNKSTTKVSVLYIKTNDATWNSQSLVRKTITQWSCCGIDAYRFQIYPLDSEFQILHSAFIKFAHILITSALLHSFSLIIRHTFSVMFRSGDCTGHVIPWISFSILG